VGSIRAVQHSEGIMQFNQIVTEEAESADCVVDIFRSAENGQTNHSSPKTFASARNTRMGEIIFPAALELLKQ